MSKADQFRFLSRSRRTREDRRFVLGLGTYVADVHRPGMLSVAFVASNVPSGRIVSIDTERARRAPGVHAVVDGATLAASVSPMRQYVPLPNVHWYPLANGRVRYAGEWLVAVVADSRALAEDAAELVEVLIDEEPAVIDPERAIEDDAPLVHPEQGSNIAYRRLFRWGDTDADFAAAARSLSLRVHWGRSSTVPLETFGVLAEWDRGRRILDVWSSIQMPQYAEQIARGLGLPLSSIRVHWDVDVGGSYGVKRGIKHSVLAGYLTMLTGRPVQLLEDRIDNLRGGDSHGPDRIFDVTLAYDDDGTIRSMRMRALDDVGAYPGRSPLQLGKPIGALVGPYTIGSVDYEAISVMTHKTGQVAVRGFGQGPTNYALESAVDAVARELGLDPSDVRRRNLIPHEAFPYEIPTGTTYDSGNYEVVLDKALVLCDIEALRARRDAIRAEGRLAGIGFATCLEPSGGNALFEPLFNAENRKTTFPEAVRLRIDGFGEVTATIAFSSAGQGHETMVSTLVGEELGIEPELIRVVRATSQDGLPTQSPVASRMTIVVGSAIKSAADKLRQRMLRVAAHELDVEPVTLTLDGRGAIDADGELALPWSEIVEIAHFQYHRLAPGEEPGLDATSTAQTPTAGTLPTEDGRVHMYPCYAFSTHVVLASIDPGTGGVVLEDYATVHDAGTVVNPDIVRGMVLGGIAHGIGAALYEQFSYSESGQPLATSFNEYLLPSMSEVPLVHMDEHCTPSPFTSHGQKGIGEGGYMAAPAAVANAVNDALSPHGVAIRELPMRPSLIWSLLQGAGA